MPWWQIILLALVPLLATTLGWWLRARFAQRSFEQQRLYDFRSKLYMDAIEPYVRVTQKGLSTKETKRVEQQMRSFEYRRAMTELTLIGSDEVVNAVNAFMGYMYQAGDKGVSGDEASFLRLWGAVYLAIRRDLGNPNTRLNEVDMFRHMITDIAKLDSRES